MGKSRLSLSEEKENFGYRLFVPCLPWHYCEAMLFFCRLWRCVMLTAIYCCDTKSLGNMLPIQIPVCQIR